MTWRAASCTGARRGVDSPCLVLDSGGNNKVVTGDGDDRITTGAGNDEVDGGNGFDLCSPGTGNDRVKDCEGAVPPGG